MTDLIEYLGNAILQGWTVAPASHATVAEAIEAYNIGERVQFVVTDNSGIATGCSFTK